MNAASKTGVRLRARNLSKTYGRAKKKSLAHVDLEVAAGETLAVLGPSGCGKTTLLRLIAGLETPDEGGAIWFGEDDVTTTPVERRQVGIVFQSYALFPNMSVADNVGYGLKLRNVARPEREAAVAELLRTMDLDGYADRRIASLSGGQRQRVALARALAIRPRILLLDEPLSALDAALRDHLRGQVAAMLRRFHITALYVTHDQGEAMEIGDRIAVMQGGRIIQLGTAQEIYETPTTRFVAEFVGEMNRLSGRMAARAGLGERDVWFRPEAARLAAPGAGELEGRVTQATFFGAQTRMIVACEGEEISLFAAPAAAAAVGAAVGVEIDAAAVLRFAEE
ncbi:MAG: ABC transporter ATP-binding protein [Roseiarcus sp.]